MIHPISFAEGGCLAHFIPPCHWLCFLAVFDFASTRSHRCGLNPQAHNHGQRSEADDQCASAFPTANVPKPNVTANVPKPTLNVIRPTVTVTRPTVNTPKIEVPKADVAVTAPKAEVPRHTIEVPKGEPPKLVGVGQHPTAELPHGPEDVSKGGTPKLVDTPAGTTFHLNTDPPVCRPLRQKMAACSPNP